jgi:anti-sigma factor RsiW
MQTDLHSDPHRAMRSIVDKSLAGEASPAEQQTLRAHLPVCEACQTYLSESRRAIVSLGGFSFASFATDPGLQAKVHASLALRAQQLQTAQPNRPRIVLVSIAALLLTIVGSLGALMIGNPLAAALHLPLAQAQGGLFTFWIVPSWCFALVLPLLLLLRDRSTNAKGSVL